MVEITEIKEEAVEMVPAFSAIEEEGPAMEEPQEDSFPMATVEVKIEALAQAEVFLATIVVEVIVEITEVVVEGSSTTVGTGEVTQGVMQVVAVVEAFSPIIAQIMETQAALEVEVSLVTRVVGQEITQETQEEVELAF